MTSDRVTAFQNLRQALTTAPLLLMLGFKLAFKIYMNESGDGLGASLHQVQIINEKAVEGPICLIPRKMKPAEARYGESQMECLCPVWALEKLNYLVKGCVLEIITEFTTVKQLLKMQISNRNMLIWQIAIQEYRGNMTIVKKDGNIPKNAYGLRIWSLLNDMENTAYVTEDDYPQIPIKGISFKDLNTMFFEELRNRYTKDKNFSILFPLLTKYSKYNYFIDYLY
ncbi:hypothetical protein O181_007037 [Austropuccinia psidii MF-1]|uniref:Reverse transcriptase/retrotransposon-derived protein RNase H-like domain-containing protein n=1 Tax=Austropuccinia psidii MF-1 TaxID=1389203 RepID=A0A9Q3GI37_9BASI|nr:hypothetical protein [Austropuccinia psidii MF-1]